MDATQHALIVVLTGGIASGKSAAADAFRGCGTPVCDADMVTRDLVAPGSPALADIARTFGPDALLADGSLDRRAMRARVFENATERRRLEAILHPRVREALLAAARDCTAAYCVLMIPLFAEVRAQYAFVDRVLVVDVSAGVQLARLMQRDRPEHGAAERMIAAQAARAQRLALADDVVDNDGDLAALGQAIARLHRMYLALAVERAAARPPSRPRMDG